MAETTDDSTVSRRNFLRGALTAMTVVGFDVHFRSWVTAADLAAAEPADGFQGRRPAHRLRPR